jgi:AcrR family transcriptional regulator
VLDAAVALFAERGYHGTSMRDIARAVDVKAASIYEHFPSKAHILAAIGAIGHDLIRRMFDETIAQAPPDPAGQVRALVEGSVRTVHRYAELAMVVGTELRALPPDLRRIADWARVEMSLPLIAVVSRGVDEGTFADRSVGVLVTSIASMCVRVPYWFTPTATYGVEDLAHDYGDLALAMLTAPAR